MRTLPCLVLLACSGPTGSDVTDTDTGTTTPVPTGDTAPETTDPPDGACGEIRTWDMTMRGVVHDEQGSPAPNATVWLEDRGWAPTVETLGTATTDAGGAYELAVSQLTDAENCWGTLLDYVLVAELGQQRGEDEVNTWLFAAIEDGTLEADVTTPLVMDQTTTP